MTALFPNRPEAGRALGEQLGHCSGSGTVVLGLEKGGCIVGAELGRRLGSPFDLLPVQPFDLPCDRKTTLGMVGPGGACVLDDGVVDRFDVEADAIGALRGRADAELGERDRLLRGGRPLPPLDGRTVVLVDDLITSTMRARVAILFLRQHRPRKVIVAAPGITQEAVRDLHPLVSEVIAIEVPAAALSLGDVYGDADVPSDPEVRRTLRVSEPAPEALTPAPRND